MTFSQINNWLILAEWKIRFVGDPCMRTNERVNRLTFEWWNLHFKIFFYLSWPDKTNKILFHFEFAKTPLSILLTPWKKNTYSLKCGTCPSYQFSPASRKTSFFLYQNQFAPFSRQVHRSRIDDAESHTLAWVVAEGDTPTPAPLLLPLCWRQERLRPSRRKVFFESITNVE